MIDMDSLKIKFKKKFGIEPSSYFVSYGRLEILGNHTDHNNGLCLTSTASMGIKAAVSEQKSKITIHSRGYKPFSFDLDGLEMKEEEKFTTIALTKGVVSRFIQLGYKVGGFAAFMDCDIFKGAGVSSSACYELLIATILNDLYNENQIDRVTLAKIGQYAENEYFGKPCGLLDQMGAALGGVTFIDFRDVGNPLIKNLVWPKEWDLSIILVNPGQSHAKLSHLYASIPSDMKKVANAYGKNTLREIDEKTFFGTIESIDTLSRIEKDRAIHFFNENKRVLEAVESIEKKDKQSFLLLIKETADSCLRLLKNSYIPGQYENSPQEAIDYGYEHLKNGAIRAMGGGFGGSVICFVGKEEEETFIKSMRDKYGDDSAVIVEIPPVGPHKINQ